MTGFAKRLHELECEQETLETQMEKLKIQFKSSDQSGYVNQFQREARGLQRKITNLESWQRASSDRERSLWNRLETPFPSEHEGGHQQERDIEPTAPPNVPSLGRPSLGRPSSDQP